MGLANLQTPHGSHRLYDLAEACRRHHRYEMFLTAAPLHLPGGIGSPANAVAIL